MKSDPCKISPFLPHNHHMDSLKIPFLRWDDPSFNVTMIAGEFLITNFFDQVFGEAPFQFCTIRQEKEFSIRMTGYSMNQGGHSVFCKYFGVN